MGFEKEIEIGSDADLDIEIGEGKVKLSLGYEGKGAKAGVFVEIKAEYFIDKLKKAIPGEIDDAILEMLKGAFLK